MKPGFVLKSSSGPRSLLLARVFKIPGIKVVLTISKPTVLGLETDTEGDVALYSSALREREAKQS